MKKYFLITTVVIFLAVIIFSGIVKLLPAKNPQKIDTTNFTMIDPGITVTAPMSKSTVASPILIKGQINGFGWTGFEGQVGTVTLADGNGNTLAQTFLPAKTDWMKLPVQFETTLEATLPKGSSGTLIFRNENASGEESRNKVFKLPVSF